MKDELNFDVFDEDQKKVLINLVDKLEEKTKSQKDDFGFEEDPRLKKDRANLKKVEKVWRSNGYVDMTTDRVSLDQLLDKDKEVTRLMRDNFSTDHPLLIPRVLSTMVREAIEPNLVLTPLMTRINYSAGTRVSFPTYGALANAAADLAEGEEYPEGTMEMGGQTECIIGKSGIACKVTEEQRRYSQFDIISMNLRACGRALARHKEKKVANLITSNGTILIDNTSTAYPSATGRSASGAYNGTLTLDDMFKAWATMADSGFIPNTLIMHPFSWRIFAEQGMARAFGFENGMASMFWQNPNGSVGNAPQWAQTMLNQNTYVSSPENIATTFTRVPSMFPSAFNIIVSPYMTYNSSNNTTDIVFCDVNELGILVVDEEVTSDEWTDPSKDIMKVKFRERYGLAVKNDGRGIGLFKNIKIGKNFDFADRVSVSYATGDLANGLGTDESYTGNPL
jgi:hypothetical protein